jgi:hypothetical protein
MVLNSNRPGKTPASQGMTRPDGNAVPAALVVIGVMASGNSCARQTPLRMTKHMGAEAIARTVSKSS